MMQPFHSMFNNDEDDSLFGSRLFPRHVNRHFADFAAWRNDAFGSLDDVFSDDDAHGLLQEDHPIFAHRFGKGNTKDVDKENVHQYDAEKENASVDPDRTFYSKSFSSSSVMRRSADGTVKRVVRKCYRDSEGQDKELHMLSTGDKRYTMRRNGDDKQEEFEGDGVKSLEDFRNVWHDENKNTTKMVEDAWSLWFVNEK